MVTVASAAVVINEVTLPEGTLADLARRAGLQSAKRNADVEDICAAVVKGVKGLKLGTTGALCAMNRLVTLVHALRNGLLPEFQEPGLGAVALPLPIVLLTAAESCAMATNAQAELVFDLAQLRVIATHRPEPPLAAVGGTRH